MSSETTGNPFIKKPIDEVRDSIRIINRDIKIMQNDIKYIIHKIDLLNNIREKEIIQDLNMQQDGWFLFDKNRYK